MCFMPRRALFEPFESKRKRNNFKLHVHCVLFMGICDEFVTGWPNMDKGVVDSEIIPSTSRARHCSRTAHCGPLVAEDLSLNTSRETLLQWYNVTTDPSLESYVCFRFLSLRGVSYISYAGHAIDLQA